jgi:hypothetical protein
MPKHGVKLSFIDEFINSCGGPSKLNGLTTTEIKEKFILPMTEQHKCSLNDLLREIKHPAYHEKADVFVSHAWKYEFVKVVDILKHHFTARPDVVIWFDVFSINQHQETSLDYGWWATTFRNAIAEFGHTVMVLMPWDDPIPLKRAWCLFELFCTHDTGSLLIPGGAGRVRLPTVRRCSGPRKCSRHCEHDALHHRCAQERSFQS